MTLQEYKAQGVFLNSRRTVAFLVQNDQVLLGYKKSGFGQGNYVGIGGKMEEGESTVEAAKREIFEEIGVDATELKSAGIVKFYFPKEHWNQEVHIFLVTEWVGKPEESEEIAPKWFPVDELPLDEMWDDAKHWIPKILAGEEITGEFLFNDDLSAIDSSFT